MTPIYNEYLAIGNDAFRDMDDRFTKLVCELFKEAESLDLNFREVSHHFQSTIACVESDHVLQRACRMRKERDGPTLRERYEAKNQAGTPSE